MRNFAERHRDLLSVMALECMRRNRFPDGVRGGMNASISSRAGSGMRLLCDNQIIRVRRRKHGLFPIYAVRRDCGYVTPTLVAVLGRNSSLTVTLGLSEEGGGGPPTEVGFVETVAAQEAQDGPHP